MEGEREKEVKVGIGRFYVDVGSERKVHVIKETAVERGKGGQGKFRDRGKQEKNGGGKNEMQAQDEVEIW